MFKKIISKSTIALFAAFLSINAAWADFSFNEIELKFAQVSDVHLSEAPDTTYKVLSHSKELLDSAIQDINKIKGLDFVAFTGDMVNEPTKQNYKNLFISLLKLDYPALLVLGNHDSITGESESTDYLSKEIVHSIITRCNPYQNYGMPYFAYSPNKDYRVIVLDTTTGNLEKSNGYLPQEQLQFLDNEINQNQDKVIIIFQHHPVIEPFKSEDHKLTNADEYLNILKKYEKVPIAIFAGHYHSARIERKGNTIFVATPSLVTYPNAFRTVSVTNYNDRVIFQFNFHETKLDKIQEISKAGLIASAAFSGAPGDKNNQIMIRKGYVPKETLTKEEIKARKESQKAEKKLQKEEKKQKAKALKAEKKEAKKMAKNKANEQQEAE